MNNIVKKKKSLVLSAMAVIIILGLFSLILIGCPKDPPGGGNPCPANCGCNGAGNCGHDCECPTPSNPCPGNAGCNCGGTNCSYDAPCKCTPKISIDGGSLEVMLVLAMSAQTIPDWGNFDNQNQDVTVSGSTITVINPVSDILIIKNHNSVDYGKALGAKGAVSITVGGITGFSVYSYDGSKWALVKSTTYGPPVLSFTWDSGNQTMSLYSALGATVPVWNDLNSLSSNNTDVKKVGDTVHVNTGKAADILVVTTVDGVHYGKVISSQSAGSYPITGISGFSSYAVYSKNGGTWFKVGSEYYTPSDTRTNFIASPTSLGLPSGTYTTGAGPGSLIDAMETRWDNALNLDDGYGNIFYPVLNRPTGNTTVAEVSNLPYCTIYENAPEILFLMKGNYLYIWGINNEIVLNVSISFDIAIISTVDGKGWLKSKTESYLNTSPGRVESYDISSLTNGVYSSVSELSDYNVYVIVRSTTYLSSSGISDLNLNTYGQTINVIKVN